MIHMMARCTSTVDQIACLSFSHQVIRSILDAMVQSFPGDAPNRRQEEIEQINVTTKVVLRGTVMPASIPSSFAKSGKQLIEETAPI